MNIEHQMLPAYGAIVGMKGDRIIITLLYS
jgi:hypothetical protein